MPGVNYTGISENRKQIKIDLAIITVLSVNWLLVNSFSKNHPGFCARTSNKYK